MTPELAGPSGYILENAGRYGPWVQLAAFCQDFSEDREGQLTIFKVLDELSLKDLGELRRAIYFVLLVQPEAQERAAGVTVFVESDEEGAREVAWFGFYPSARQGVAHLPGGDSVPHPVSAILVVWLDALKPGKIWYVVRADERVLTRVPLVVLDGPGNVVPEEEKR